VLQGTLEQVEEAYGGEVRFVFRQFPLIAIHPQATDAAEASLCARDQDSFWEMHDAMFANQRALQVDQLKATARDLGLDGAQFDVCMDSDRYADEVAFDLEAGQKAGVSGTPVIFINGRALSGAKPFEEIAEIIEDELRRAGG
jgi:protein-disulfide isomerase